MDFQHPHRTLLPLFKPGAALRRGRGNAVVDEALGESFSGVLVSDCYADYHHYDGPKQRCWAHLLRDIHDLVALYPKDTLSRVNYICRSCCLIQKCYRKLSTWGVSQGILFPTQRPQMNPGRSRVHELVGIQYRIHRENPARLPRWRAASSVHRYAIALLIPAVVRPRAIT